MRALYRVDIGSLQQRHVVRAGQRPPIPLGSSHRPVWMRRTLASAASSSYWAALNPAGGWSKHEQHGLSLLDQQCAVYGAKPTRPPRATASATAALGRSARQARARAIQRQRPGIDRIPGCAGRDKLRLAQTRGSCRKHTASPARGRGGSEHHRQRRRGRQFGLPPAQQPTVDDATNLWPAIMPAKRRQETVPSLRRARASARRCWTAPAARRRPAASNR